MGNRRSRKKKTVYGRANREDRNHKVISAYRVMEREDSLAIAATVEGLDFNEDILEYEKVPRSHRAFILDPRIVNRHFKSGFEHGFSFARALDATRRNGRAREDTAEARIGEIFIVRRKHVFARVMSKIIAADTVAMKEVLGDEGLKGLRGSHARRAAAPVIHLAQFKPGVVDSPEVQADYVSTLETAFVVHNATNVTFGEVQVVEKQ